MDLQKLRVKIGNNEFDAEGLPENVKHQFEAFLEILRAQSEQRADPEDSTDNPQLSLLGPPAGSSPPSAPTWATPPPNPAHVPLDRIMKVQGRIVSLTLSPATTQDAALLILLGNKDLRSNEMATGQEIGDGLAQSGRPVPRVDRIMDKMIEEALVLKSGFKRGTRYRLSNTGLQKALSIARELIATLP